MGTRHLILIWQGGKYRLAQYGQWSGNPQSQGVAILEFLRHSTNISKLAANLPKLYHPSDEELKKIGAEADEMIAKARPEFNALNEDAKRGLPESRGEEVMKRWDDVEARLFRPLTIIAPSLSRETGAKILTLIANATKPLPVDDDIRFITDQVSCEWAYVIDVDTSVLEVYRSEYFSKIPHGACHSTRFEGIEGCEDPISMAATFKLDALPQDDKAFVEACGDEWYDHDTVDDSEEEE